MLKWLKWLKGNKLKSARLKEVRGCSSSKEKGGVYNDHIKDSEAFNLKITNGRTVEGKFSPVIEGLEVADIERVLEQHDKEITKIRDMLDQCSPPSDEEWEKYYVGAILGLARAVHWLPASEYNHHQDAGGLFRHSLDTAYRCLRLARYRLPPQAAFPNHNARRKPVWIFLAFLTGLCHDIAKPVTDMRIFADEGEQLWNPADRNLSLWLENLKMIGCTRYFIEWRKDRHRAHEEENYTVFLAVMPFEVIEYMKSQGEELSDTFIVAVGGAKSDEYLESMLAKADENSSRIDFVTQTSADTGDAKKEPLTILRDAMRYKRKNWVINEPEGDMWHTSIGLLMCYPHTINQSLSFLGDPKKIGVSSKEEVNLQRFLDTGLAVKAPDGSSYMFVRQTPESPWKKVFILRDAGVIYEDIQYPPKVQMEGYCLKESSKMVRVIPGATGTWPEHQVITLKEEIDNETGEVTHIEIDEAKVEQEQPPKSLDKPSISKVAPLKSSPPKKRRPNAKLVYDTDSENNTADVVEVNKSSTERVTSFETEAVPPETKETPPAMRELSSLTQKFLELNRAVTQKGRPGHIKKRNGNICILWPQGAANYGLDPVETAQAMAYDQIIETKNGGSVMVTGRVCTSVQGLSGVFVVLKQEFSKGFSVKETKGNGQAQPKKAKKTQKQPAQQQPLSVENHGENSTSSLENKQLHRLNDASQNKSILENSHKGGVKKGEFIVNEEVRKYLYWLIKKIEVDTRNGTIRMSEDDSGYCFYKCGELTHAFGDKRKEMFAAIHDVYHHLCHTSSNPDNKKWCMLNVEEIRQYIENN